MSEREESNMQDEPIEPTGSTEPGEPVEPDSAADASTGDVGAGATADASAAPLDDASADAAPAAEAAPGAADAADDLTDEDRALLEGEAAAIEAERAAFEAKSAAQLDELARLRAEYVNYRNRTERERATDRDSTTASVIKIMLPALDDLELAEKHGDLAEGPLAIVAQKLRGSFDQLGVVKLGEVGEAFDIDKHEAIAQLPNPEVTEMVVADVVQSGYRVGDRMLRAAKVAVFVPAE